MQHLRTKRIVIRVTPKQHADFARAARAADQTVSGWARAACSLRAKLGDGK